MAQDERERHELRSRSWRRSSHGYYVPAHLGRTPAQRIVEASALLPVHGAIGGWAAAHWQRAPFFEGVDGTGIDLPILLCIGEARMQKRPGVELLRNALPESDVIDVGGIRCTTPLRTALDLARRSRHLFGAVAAIDTLLECGLIDRAGLAGYIDGHRGWRGIATARRAVVLAVDGVRSPPETWLRLTWTVTAGLPAPMVNKPLYSRDGPLLGIPDLFDVEAATVVEYDGEDHQLADQRQADAQRDRLFVDHGLTIVRVAKDEMAKDRGDELISRLATARLRGLARDRSRDRWTLTPPAGEAEPA